MSASACQRLIGNSRSVTGIRRADEQGNRLAKLGIHHSNLDITEAGASTDEESFDHVVVAVSLAQGQERINVSSKPA